MRIPLAMLIPMLISVTQAPSVPASHAVPIFGDECAVPPGFSPPFVRVYRFANGGRLVFVAVRHKDAPTQAMLKAAFVRYHPDKALVEGIGSSRRDDAERRQRLLAYADDRLATGEPDEVATTIKLAASAQVAFSGWDLAPEEEYAAALSAGFTSSDIVGAHLARRRIDPFGTNIGPALAAERQADPAVAVEGFDYPAWYRRSYGDRFIISSGTPCGTGIAAQVVKAETGARNRNAAAVLERTVVAGRTVLIEAGANHWLALDPWLRSIAVAEGAGTA